MSEQKVQPKFRVRGETRLKNFRLVAAREELSLTCKEFAARFGLNYVMYNGLENLRGHPSQGVARRLAEFCACSVGELFPDGTEVDVSRLMGATLRQALLVPGSSDPLQDVVLKELRSEIERALGKIDPRQAKVVRLYFGLDDGDPMELDQIGEAVGFSRERSRQMLARGLYGIKRSRDAHRLESFMY